MKKTRFPLLGLFALAALLPASARPQEGQEPETPDPFAQEAPSQDELQQQLIDLIHKVERRLEAIDTKLSDAGAGVAPLEGVEDSGLDDLLRQARNQSKQNIEDIDRILEIAGELNSQQSGGSQSAQPQQQPSESPLDKERDRGPQERENTPSEPQQEQEGQEQQGEQEQEEPQPSENPKDGQNREGDDRSDPSSAGPSAADDANRWGELPVRYREVFRNQGGEELPVQYRDWIDAYHRRLSKSRR